MIIFGKNAVLEALKSEKTFNSLLIDKKSHDGQIQEIINMARENGIKVNFAERVVLEQKLAKTNREEKHLHQGVVGEIVDFEYSDLEDILENAKNKNVDDFVVILDGVEDPHNLGAIIRTAECAGVTGIIIPEHRACAVNETVIKTSAGATANVKLARVTNINSAIEKLKENGVWVYACEVGGDDIFKTNLTGKIAIVLGSEGKGVSQLTLKNCDGKFSIPMFGKINSLNVSVASAISIYEVIRQRNKK